MGHQHIKTTTKNWTKRNETCGNGLTGHNSDIQTCSDHKLVSWTQEVIKETESKWQYINGRFMTIYENGAINRWANIFNQGEKACARLTNEWSSVLVRYPLSVLEEVVNGIINNLTKFSDSPPQCIQFNSLCVEIARRSIRKSQNFLPNLEVDLYSDKIQIAEMKCMIKCFKILGRPAKAKAIWEELQEFAKKNHLDIKKIIGKSG